MQKRNKIFLWLLDNLEYFKNAKEPTPTQKVEKIQRLTELEEILKLPADQIDDRSSDLSVLEFGDKLKGMNL